MDININLVGCLYGSIELDLIKYKMLVGGVRKGRALRLRVLPTLHSPLSNILRVILTGSSVAKTVTKRVKAAEDEVIELL